MTTIERLGRRIAEPPAGAGPAAYAHPELVILDESECLRLLEPGGIGRIAYEGRYGPGRVERPGPGLASPRHGRRGAGT